MKTIRLLFILTLAGLLGPASGLGAPAKRAAGSGQAQPPSGQELTEEQFQQRLDLLKKHLQRRGESEEYINLFLRDLQTDMPEPDATGRIPVTAPVLESFLKYEVAWARKTRDSKNPQVSPEQLQRETAQANELKSQFKAEAHQLSPAFYSAYQKAVNDVKKARADAGAGGSAGMFSGQTDDSYSHVDAGAADLEQGDAQGAAAEASQAISEEGDNSEAYSLRAAADYAQQNYPAAVQDATTALQLDPNNQQAQAVLGLSDSAAPADAGTLAQAATAAGGLPGEFPAPNAASGDNVVVAAGAAPAPAVPNAPATLAPAPASLSAPTPAQSAAQSVVLAQQGQAAIKLGDTQSAIAQLNQAVTLNPLNTTALNLRAIAKAHDGQYASALRDVNQSLLLSPRNSASLDVKAMISNRAKDYVGALAAANEALRVDSRDAHAYLSQAHALAGQGDRSGMLESLRRAASLDPAYQKALQTALTQAPSADLTLLFPDQGALRDAAGRQTVRRHHSSAFRRFIRRNGLESLLGNLEALGALGAVLAGLLALLAWPRKAQAPAPEPWSLDR